MSTNKEDVTQLTLLQKLARIRKQVEVVKKNKNGYNYKYVTDEELLARITTLLDKYEISLIPSVKPETLKHEQYHYIKTKTNKKTGELYDEANNEIIVEADMKFTWIDNRNPANKIEVPWIMIGQQADASQAMGSGLTYAMRYFLLKYFNVATPEDDVDNFRSKQRAIEAAEDKAIAENLINEADEIVRSYIEENPKQAGAVKKLVTQYVKSGNYFEITESKLAAKLLSDIKNNFSTKG